MAFTNDTVQALGVLNQILGRAHQSREADENRGVQILQMRIQSEERQADRMGRALASMENEYNKLRSELVKTTGIQRKLEGIASDPNYSGDGKSALGLVNKQSQVMAMDIKSMGKRMMDLRAKREEATDRLKQYYEAYNTVAPEQFERYVAAGKDQTLSGISTIGDDEFEMAKADMRKSGIEMTPEREAGLRAALNKLGAERFDQEYKERILGMQNAELALKRKGQDLEAAELALKMGSGQNKNALKGLVDDYNATAKTIASLNDEFEFTKGQFNIPMGLPRDAASTDRARNDTARVIADWAKKYRDSDLGPKMNKLLDEYSEAVDNQDVKGKTRLSHKVADEFMAQRSKLSKLDYSWMPFAGGGDPGQREFASSLLDAYGYLSTFKAMQMGVNDELVAGTQNTVSDAIGKAAASQIKELKVKVKNSKGDAKAEALQALDAIIARQKELK